MASILDSLEPDFHLQLIRAQNSVECEPERFQTRAVTLTVRDIDRKIGLFGQGAFAA
ncbi:MAG: hypothetical protein ACXW00_00160 [Methylobacter sp.]